MPIQAVFEKQSKFYLSPKAGSDALWLMLHTSESSFTRKIFSSPCVGHFSTNEAIISTYRENTKAAAASWEEELYSIYSILSIQRQESAVERKEMQPSSIALSTPSSKMFYKFHNVLHTKNLNISYATGP